VFILKFIEIKLTKHSIYLTEGEITSLLAGNQDLYIQGIKRGKAIKRSNDLKQRIEKKIINENENY
jgi:hypothetical protein